ASTNSIVKLPGIDKYEIYDYPGEYNAKGEGDAEVKLRMEEEEAAHDVVHASSLCRTFTPGGKFKVTKHISDTEQGKTYVITSIHHSATEVQGYASGGGAGAEYTNTFT